MGRRRRRPGSRRCSRLDEPVGSLRAEVAEPLGIPAGAVVYAGVNDTQAGSVATDAYRPGRGGLSIGTTSVLVDAIATKEVDLDHEVLSCPGPFGDRYLVFAENGLGGKPLEHVLDNVVDTGGFDTLDEVLAAVPAGSGGVLFLPWLRGSMAPANDANMRGGYVNMSLDIGRDELVRATCEGVAHNLAWLLPHVEALDRRTASTRSSSSAAPPARPARPRSSPTCSTAPWSPPTSRRSPSPGPRRCSSLHRHGVLSRDELSRPGVRR